MFCIRYHCAAIKCWTGLDERSRNDNTQIGSYGDDRVYDLSIAYQRYLRYKDDDDPTQKFWAFAINHRLIGGHLHRSLARRHVVNRKRTRSSSDCIYTVNRRRWPDGLRLSFKLLLSAWPNDDLSFFLLFFFISSHRQHFTLYIVRVVVALSSERWPWRLFDKIFERIYQSIWRWVTTMCDDDKFWKV